MGPRAYSWEKGVQGSQKVPKPKICESIWELIWERCFYTFWGDVSLSSPGRLLGALSAQKAPNMESKWSQKSTWRHFVGSARTMVFTVREAYWALSGRLREATFFRLRLQTLFGGFLGSTFADVRRFGMPFGAPWDSIFDSKL